MITCASGSSSGRSHEKEQTKNEKVLFIVLLRKRWKGKCEVYASGGVQKNILMMCKLPPQYFPCFTILRRCLLLLINIKLDVFASWYVMIIATVIITIILGYSANFLKVLMRIFFLLRSLCVYEKF